MPLSLPEDAGGNASVEKSAETALPTVLTTWQAAELLHVSPRTVANWCDRGTLTGWYRLPGSLHRHIPREALVRFAARNGLPLGDSLLRVAHLHAGKPSEDDEVFCTDTFALGQAAARGTVTTLHIDPDLFCPGLPANTPPAVKEERVRAIIAEATARAGIACPEVVFVEGDESAVGKKEAA